MRSRNNGGDQHGEQWQINVLNVQKDVEKHGFPFGTWSSDLLFHGGKKPHRTWSKYVKNPVANSYPIGGRRFLGPAQAAQRNQRASTKPRRCRSGSPPRRSSSAGMEPPGRLGNEWL